MTESRGKEVASVSSACCLSYAYVHLSILVATYVYNIQTIEKISIETLPFQIQQPIHLVLESFLLGSVYHQHTTKEQDSHLIPRTFLLFALETVCTPGFSYL